MIHSVSAFLGGGKTAILNNNKIKGSNLVHVHSFVFVFIYFVMDNGGNQETTF